MRRSAVFASLFFHLLLTTTTHGVRNLETQRQYAASNNKDARDSDKWQQPSSVSAGRPMDGRGGLLGDDGATPITGAGRGGAEMTTVSAREVVASRVHDEGYVGPSGHSPNHHRANPCGPCT